MSEITITLPTPAERPLDYTLEKLDLKPGNVLVCRSQYRLTREQARSLSNLLREKLGRDDIKIIIADLDMRIEASEGFADALCAKNREIAALKAELAHEVLNKQIAEIAAFRTSVKDEEIASLQRQLADVRKAAAEGAYVVKEGATLSVTGPIGWVDVESGGTLKIEQGQGIRELCVPEGAKEVSGGTRKLSADEIAHDRRMGQPENWGPSPVLSLFDELIQPVRPTLTDEQRKQLIDVMKAQWRGVDSGQPLRVEGGIVPSPRELEFVKARQQLADACPPEMRDLLPKELVGEPDSANHAAAVAAGKPIDPPGAEGVCVGCGEVPASFLMCGYGPRCCACKDKIEANVAAQLDVNDPKNWKKTLGTRRWIGAATPPVEKPFAVADSPSGACVDCGKTPCGPRCQDCQERQPKPESWRDRPPLL